MTLSWSPEYLYQFKFKVGHLKVTIEQRHGPKHNFWGRFGGGWNWKFGVQACSTCVILELLVMSIRFDWYEKKEG